MSATPPLRKLEYVLAVARELHFRRAAERVHVVQSSLSRQVREFEAELGFEIFYRNNHLVDLTDAGRAFTLALEDSLTRFLAEFTRARDLSRLISRRNATSCLIGYSPFVPATLRHEIRSIRRLKFPSVRLQFRLATESEMTDSLGSGVFQAGVTFAPLERNRLQQIPLRTEPLYAVSVRGHSSNGSGAIRLAELRTHPLIVPCSQRAYPALYQWLHGQFAVAGVRPNIVEEASSTQEVFDLVQDGVGTAIVPAGICDEVPPALQCSPIHGMEALQLVFIYRYGSSPTAQRIVSEIANSLRHAYLAKAGVFFCAPVIPICGPSFPKATRDTAVIARRHQVSQKRSWTTEKFRANLFGMTCSIGGQVYGTGGTYESLARMAEAHSSLASLEDGLSAFSALADRRACASGGRLSL